MFKLRKLIKFKRSCNGNKDFIFNLIESSAPKTDFYLMVLFSSLITTLGLISNNLVLVIAGMIVAPLLSPILAISIALVVFNFKMMIRSFLVLIPAIIIAILASFLLGVLFVVDINKIEMISRVNLSSINFLIAVISGIIASYAWTRKNSKDYLSGVAIAVTIMPPISLLGLTLFSLDFALSKKIIIFILMNIIGILLGSLLVFIFINFKKEKKTIEKEIEKEDLDINI